MGRIKHFGLGIVDKNNEPFDPAGMNVHAGEEGILALVEELNHDSAFKEFAPFRPVELFYKDEQSSGEWIENKGVCMVPGETMVEVKFRCGETDNKCSADSWSWELFGGSYSITHYRVHQL